MKVAHVYDDLDALVVAPDDPEDIGGEWEDARTVQGQVDALHACGHTVLRVPFDEHMFATLARERPDCVFNISEGRRGKDRESIVPAICRYLNIPCTSSDAVAMGVTLDKAMSKAIAHAHGVPTPRWALVRKPDEIDGADKGLRYPLFVKPNFEGSSMGIRPDSLVDAPERLAEGVRRRLARIGPVMVEEAMPGAEYTVALLGNDEPQAFPIAEIRTAGRIYDKSMKSKDRMEEEVICPAELPEGVADRLLGWSHRLFAAYGLAGPARFDYKCDAEGRPQFLEVNPLPGLSRYYSVYTIQAKAAGLEYDAMIGRLVELAVARHGAKR